MTLHINGGRPAGRAARRWATTLVAAGTLGAAWGCSGLLDVTNPNNVNASALTNPASAAAQVNGIVAALTKGATQLMGDIEIASDDMTWSGSLDGLNQLNRGFVRDAFNEFLEDGAFGMNPARYSANRVIKQLEEFQKAGTLADASQLALANLYAAVTYDLIANHYDDYVISSDQRIAGAPVGPDKMVTLYDSVEAAVGRGLAVAPSASTTLRGQLTAMRARAKFDRAVWKMLNPTGKTPAQPLVNDQGAYDDAQAALTLLGSDARFKLEPQTGMSYGNCFLPSCTNSRREIKFSPAIATYDYLGTKTLTVALKDPISGQPDPVINLLGLEFVNGNLLSPVTITGSRDMLLIMAEVALAKGNTADFTTRINALRALNNLPPWTGAAGQPSALEMLKYERRVNLFMQGRRLNDMYRFGIVDAEWASNSDAVTCPGSMFPITNSERLTNPLAASSTPSCGK
jgi:hypothetical protein